MERSRRRAGTRKGGTGVTITNDMKIAALKRELHLRGRVYPHRVADKRMTQAEADRQIAVMQAILADYEGPDLLAGLVAA